jgi:hypothetical protein
MKYAVILFLLMGGGATYVRVEQPALWDSVVNKLKAPPDEVSKAGGSSATPPPAPAPDNTPAPDTAPAPPVIPKKPEYITPDTAKLNEDHTHIVEQPVQPAANFAPPYVPPDPLPQQADWTWTVNGKDYMNVVVSRVDADAHVVHITYDGGVAALNLDNLSPDLKKQLNYDPAQAAAIGKAKADAAAIEAQEIPDTKSSGK